jgi:protein O-GlcNAc transferase
MSNASRLLNQAVELHQAGKLDEAATVYQRLTCQAPDNPDAWHLLGLVAAQKHDFQAAVSPIEKAVRLNPKIAEYHSNLANVYLELGRLDDALNSCRTALKLNPKSADAFDICGNVFQALEEFELAVDCHQQAVQLAPDSADAFNDLANSLRKHGRLEEARTAHERALELRPDWDLAINNYAATLLETGEMVQALQLYGQALKVLKAATIDESSFDTTRRMAQVLFNLGNAFRDFGEPGPALQAYSQSVVVDPTFAKAYGNRLYLEQFIPGVSNQHLYQLHAEWDRIQVKPLQTEHQRFENDRDPGRRLKVGILSPNFKQHPCGFFLVRGLEALNREQLEVTCYSDRAHGDPMTARIAASADNWKVVTRLSDVELTDLIRSDGIDILIVMAGHTEGNRLLVAARKPAPIVISWTGYVGTTGVSSIDYLIADRWHVREDDVPFYIERIMLMPDGYVCWDPPSLAPSIGPVPFERNGFITFGCFNQPIKYNETILKFWAQLMRRTPKSRLILIGPQVDSQAVRNRLIQPFISNGVSIDRVIMKGRMPQDQLFAHYNEVDISLDPLPFSSGITTCETLWMGVPIVTYPGDTFAGRHSLSHLSNVGLPELIATSEADCLAKIKALASDISRLAEYRLTLRDRVAASPLCDGPRFADALQKKLRMAWQEWVTR